MVLCLCKQILLHDLLASVNYNEMKQESNIIITQTKSADVEHCIQNQAIMREH